MKAEEEQRRQQKERMELEKLRQAEERKRFVLTLHEPKRASTFLSCWLNLSCLVPITEKRKKMML